jgi:transcriptional regulator with XRE-family HTH domain
VAQTFREWLWDRYREGEYPNQASFAREVGVGQATMSRYLDGKSTPVRWQDVQRLVRRFGVTAEEIQAMIVRQKTPGEGRDGGAGGPDTEVVRLPSSDPETQLRELRETLAAVGLSVVIPDWPELSEAEQLDVIRDIHEMAERHRRERSGGQQVG